MLSFTAFERCNECTKKAIGLDVACCALEGKMRTSVWMECSSHSCFLFTWQSQDLWFFLFKHRKCWINFSILSYDTFLKFYYYYYYYTLIFFRLNVFPKRNLRTRTEGQIILKLQRIKIIKKQKFGCRKGKASCNVRHCLKPRCLHTSQDNMVRGVFNDVMVLWFLVFGIPHPNIM